MKTPTEFQLSQFMHMYDAAKAHEYYIRNRKLKGRKKGADQPPTDIRGRQGHGPLAGKTRVQIAKDAKAKQKKELAAAVHGLEQRLQKLEALIKKRMHEEASDNRKSKAKKERAAKEKDKPKTAAEKAKAARENAKYRDKNQQKLKTAAKKDDKSGSGSSSKSKTSKKHSVDELKTLATRVRGQIAVAKQKLAAL